MNNVNRSNKSLFKKAIFVTVFLIFLATLPAAFQNARRSNQAEDEVRQVLKIAKRICESDCTDYPADWIIEGKKVEAESYCKSQCENNMQGIRDGLLNEQFPVLFTNKYNYGTAIIYCLLGLRCPQSTVTDVINNYSP